jgi:hypothetical protein
MVTRRKIDLADAHRQLPAGVDPTTILSLVATLPDGSHFPSGSAIAISESLALTAKHVVDDYMRFADAEKIIVRAASGLSHAHKNRAWRITASATDEVTEIALLYLGESGAPVKGLRYPALELSPPEVGAVVTAVGFAESACVPFDDKYWGWSEDPSVSFGRVLEVHPRRRDRLLMPYPSFTTSCFVRGGMSGGPVFDQAGRIVGITSRASADESAPHAVCSLVWTSLGLPLRNLPLGGDNKQYLLDLAVRGEIATENFKLIEAKFVDAGRLRLYLLSL